MVEYTGRIEKKFGDISDRLDLIADQKDKERADRIRSDSKPNNAIHKEKKISVQKSENKVPEGRLEVEEPPERRKFDELLRSF